VSTPASTVGAEAIGASRRTSRRKPRKVLSDRAKAERRLGWMLCAPAVVVMLAVTAYPILYAVYLSLLRSDLRFPGEKAWIGLDNYITVLSSSLWWKDVFHTVVLTVITVAIELVIGMLLALIMHRAIFGRGLVRTAALIPYGIVTVVAAFAWRLAFSSAEGGFVPKALHLTTDPLTSTWQTYLVAILAEVWKTTPFMALLLLAGLALVPDELHEAARVDGATAWQRFRFITLPLLMPTVVVAVLLRGIDALKTFDILYATKGKGGGSFHEVETLNIYAYGLSFDYNEYGVSSAVLIIFFLVIIGLMWALTARRKEVS
jgi:multiple sugar transport system permease protein